MDSFGKWVNEEERVFLFVVVAYYYTQLTLRED
jgi:hypothetical protein